MNFGQRINAPIDIRAFYKFYKLLPVPIRNIRYQIRYQIRYFVTNHAK